MNGFYITTTYDDILKQKYWFKRPFKEAQGYELSRKENGNGQLICNMVGVDPKDVSITVEPSEFQNRQVLKIYGKTTAYEEDFEVSYDIVLRPMKTIVPVLKDGLLVLDIEWSKPIAPDVEIKSIN